MRQRYRELIAYGVALIAVSFALVAVFTHRGALNQTAAAWVQAVGSVAAILLVTLPIYVQRGFERSQSRAIVLASAEMAFEVMKECADRYINPAYVGSEWWVPQWEIFSQSLANAPIHDTGSVEALRAFVSFQELFKRAESFSEPEPDPKDGQPLLISFVGFVMSNASREMEALRKALK